MDTRNLDRFFNINKVLEIHGKSSGNRLETMQLSVLLCIWHLAPTTAVGIERRLRYYKRTMSSIQVANILDQLLSLGFVERVNRKYVLTLSGKNLVFELETRLRKSRHDR